MGSDGMKANTKETIGRIPIKSFEDRFTQINADQSKFLFLLYHRSYGRKAANLRAGIRSLVQPHKKREGHHCNQEAGERKKV